MARMDTLSRTALGSLDMIKNVFGLSWLYKLVKAIKVLLPVKTVKR